MDMGPLLTYLAARLKEPSTYAGMAALLTAYHIIPNDPNAANTLTTAGIALGGILAALFPEQGAKK